MNNYITILRGINVGGKRIIKIDALKQLFIEIGCNNVQTYIQSGNVIYQSKKIVKESIIVKAIQSSFRFEVPVINLTSTELESIIARNPFLKDKKKDPCYFHITFLSAQTLPEKIELLKSPKEEFYCIDKAVYLYCPNGYSKSKLTNTFIENKLGVTATTRNWKTCIKLIEMSISNIKGK